MKLHDYQRYCVNWLLDKPFAGLLLEPGLGKTLTTLVALQELYLLGEVKRVLVLATKRIAQDTWPDEIEKWGINLSYSVALGTPKERLDALKEKSQITITNYDNFIWLTEHYGDDFPFDVVVVDESSHFKNNQSKRFKTFRKIRPHVKRLVILTGTPAPNSLIELWPQIYLLDQGQRLGKFIGAFRQKYFQAGASNGHIVYRWDIRNGSEERIYGKIDDVCVSMKSQDYLNLPKRVDNIVNIKFNEDLRAKYKEFEREQVLEIGSNGDYLIAVNAAVLCGKLMQFANGAVYDEHGDVQAIHDLKLEALKNIVDEAQGQPVLVFYQYQHDRDRIMQAIPEAVDIKNASVKDWNEGKIPVMLAHPKSAGHGLNLQRGGHIVVWFSMTWSLEQYQQANARLDRQGQQHPVQVHHLVANGTVDERALKVLQGKEERQEALMQALKASIGGSNDI